jgi:hypothetical protein
MKTIELTKAKVAIVDDEDYDRVMNSGYKWHANINAGGRTYVRGSKNGHHILMHRLVMNVLDRKCEVDHVNGDPLDNRKENLRIASHLQNSWNRPKSSHSRWPYKGIVQKLIRGKLRWVAKIYTEGKERHLGYFDNPEEAARAYDTAARELFGEFAKLNFA